MKVLVLGASGHVGRRLMDQLQATAWAVPVGAARRPEHTPAGACASLQLDTLDLAALTRALDGMDAVVNCVAGDARSISAGSRTLAQAALAAGCPRIVHLSTMSVYGPAEGTVTEDAPLEPSLGWYGRAKCDAEAHMLDFASRGGAAVVLRPGCVFGPGSQLWVGRIGRWLQAGRLGDLGVAGDGWSNLIHVNDVCEALMASLRLPLASGERQVFNLAAPDSPRWNDYFVDLALQIQATPVRRIALRQLQLDARFVSPPLQIAKRLLMALRRPSSLPDPMPPGLLRLWAQHIQLDAGLATKKLGLAWTPYAEAVTSSAGWFSGRSSLRAQAIGESVCAP